MTHALLMHGSDTNVQVPTVWYNAVRGQTLGHHLAGNARTTELENWVLAGGNCSLQTNERDKYPGTTPAHMVLYSPNITHEGQYRLLALMLGQNPALVHIQKGDGETLGHIAAMHGRTDLLALLARYGDHFEKRDKRGLAVMNHVLDIGHWETRMRAGSIVSPVVTQHWHDYQARLQNQARMLAAHSGPYSSAEYRSVVHQEE